MELQQSPPTPRYMAQLALLLSTFGLGFILVAALASLIASQMLHVDLKGYSTAILLPENVSALRLFTAVSSLLVFALPPIIVYSVFYHKPMQEIGFKRAGNWPQIVLMLAITACAFVAAPAFTTLMAHIPISTKWEKIFQQMEEDYLLQAKSIGNIKSFGDYIATLICLAFVPAFSEELLLRAGFQKILAGLTKNLWVGLIISGLIFTLLHESYYNFLSRYFLSIVLGLLFHYGKSIWFNITAHFLNNAYIVTLMYVAALNNVDISKYDNDPPVWVSVAFLLPVAVLFIVYIKQSKKQKIATDA